VSNSQAFPIALTTRLDEARQSIARLLGLAEAGDISVTLRAISDTHLALQRYIAAMPSASFAAEVPPELASHARHLLQPLAGHRQLAADDGGFTVFLDAAASAVVAVLESLPPIPVEVDLHTLPLDDFESSWLDVVGTDRASVLWRLAGWPAVPELGLPANHKHAHIELTINASDIDELTPTPGQHTVYIHTGGWQSEEPRAQWLAHAVGHTVIGPPEWGW
jgi:hypothetical protein